MAGGCSESARLALALASLTRSKSGTGGPLRTVKRETGGALG